MEFKDMLKYFRKREGLTQGELAAKLKVSPSRISMFEAGEREPDFETEEKIADFFNTDLNTLRGRDLEQEQVLMPKSYIKKYNSLDEIGKSNVHHCIENEYKDWVERDNAEKAIHAEYLRLLEFDRVVSLDKIENIEDAKVLLPNSAAFNGLSNEKDILLMANNMLKKLKNEKARRHDQ